MAFSIIPPDGRFWVVPTQAMMNALFQTKEDCYRFLDSKCLHFNPTPRGPHCYYIHEAFGNLQASGNAVVVHGEFFGYNDQEAVMLQESVRRGRYLSQTSKYSPDTQTTLMKIARIFDQETKKLRIKTLEHQQP
ncbi:MAG TPA: hypothetical protein VJJ80_01780 [Patescibacteria group bacterium]|nr:hypothetical protein [Patescibacteria group bacterium]